MRCCDGDSAGVAEGLKSALRRYGVLSANDAIRGAMMERAMVALRSAETTAEQVVDGSGEPGGSSWTNGSLEEWAEELATLGSRRNVLERRLRSLLVGFVRADHLRAAPQGATIKGRVLRGVRKERRSTFEHLAVEDLVSRFTWKELTELIETKEWELFERIFGDRRKFREMSDVVNDRFDAHAKDADMADIALYRRALRYLEERLEKME